MYLRISTVPNECTCVIPFARRVNCFKNIPKTLAMHHQLLMCYYLNSRTFFMEHDALTGPGKYIINSNLFFEVLYMCYGL